MPAPLFASRGERERKEFLLGIGQTDREGPLSCYLFEKDKKGNTELLYIYTGDDLYQMWRSYMLTLAELEKSDSLFNQKEYPKASDVEKTLRI